ncbi:Hypothetical protein NTJ_01907 [Nesidiocoris tenuis]|uniref:Alpha-carbonic anhydrase domain-containing protein n=1 Tax=Nesidiocoris tenuis TaxID=355587 RepID=A0ABN7AE10_9HEMI|nr:Hypothetical protein NTJ_01907 [Nesidiocoris tenuis]
MGPIRFENLWKPSMHTSLINTGSTVKLDVGNTCTLKWPPVGQVSYILENVEFYWGNGTEPGSCHSIDGKKYDLEMVFSFAFKYQVVVPADLIQNRLKLHRLYQELFDMGEETLGTEEREEKEAEIEELETYYDELEDYVLDERYLHSEAREALSKRKPTSFNIQGQLSGALHSKARDSEDDEAADDDDLLSEIEVEQVNFDREIRFGKERIIHELAAQRFKSTYESRINGPLEAGDVEELLNQRSSSNIALNRDAARTSSGIFDSTTSFNGASIDHQFFPTELSRARERLRRIRFAQGRAARLKSEEDEKTEFIRNHQVAVRTNISLFFEVKENAPTYNLFTYLPRVTEPFSQVWVDGNLLQSFQEALASTDFFAYKGSNLFQPSGDEVVWIVMKNALPLSKQQLSLFSNLKNGYGKRMVPKTVVIQPLNDRQVYFNNPTKDKEPPTCPGKELCHCDIDT